MQNDIREHFQNLEISTWIKGHFYISGFISRKTDSAIFYFNISDILCQNNQVLYRSARHLKDYIGGINIYCLTKELLEKIATECNEYIQ